MPMALPFPPNLLKTGVGPSVVQSCHSCLGEKRKIEKYVFPSSMALPCPPNPLKLSNPLQTVKSRHGKNAWVSIDLASIIGHLTFTVRRSLAQTWHLWIDCSADGNIRLTRRNVNKTQPALAIALTQPAILMPSSDRMVNQPTPQTRSSCSPGWWFLRLKINSTRVEFSKWSFSKWESVILPHFGATMTLLSWVDRDTVP